MTRVIREGKKRRTPLLAMALLGVIVGVLIGGGGFGTAASTGPSVADYSQCANGKPGTANPQNCNSGWINGILNANNSPYGEDQVTAQRLVVDTALNLGWWDLARACAFMRANTLESNPQINTETLRYSTDLPAQGASHDETQSIINAINVYLDQSGIVDIVQRARIKGESLPLKDALEKGKWHAQNAQRHIDDLMLFLKMKELGVL